MGNLQPLITQTLLPGTKEAYGQLPLQDFNLREQQPVTAYGHVTIFLVILVSHDTIHLLWQE